ncbi:MAG: rhomboid family intramembrane serine protease [Phycisphaeraceae bacterium]|nr:MAG: rhomboid family intramembrane serine protease [Phycisphaeraceae bacterium]
MGISDRDYARHPGRARGSTSGRMRLGVGSLRLLSFNAWLIGLNVAIFVLGILLAGRGVPVLIERSIDPSTPPKAKLVILDQMLTTGGQPVAPGTPVPSSGYFRRPILIEGTNQIVGTALYQMMDPLTAFGHFSTYQGFQRVEVWRLVTFQFLHANFAHLLLNMLGLYFFGGTVERNLGFKKYAAFYLVCGIFGGLAYLLLNVLGNVLPFQIPGLLFHATMMPLVGASAGVFGVIVACAYLEPRESVQLLFIPIGIPLPWFAYGYVLFSILNLLSGGKNAGGDAAHVGGAIAGYYFIRHSHLLRDFFDVFTDSRRPQGQRGRGGAGVDAEREIDRILAKVRATGADSLTGAERRTLRSATARGRGADA